MTQDTPGGDVPGLPLSSDAFCSGTPPFPWYCPPTLPCLVPQRPGICFVCPVLGTVDAAILSPRWVPAMIS